MELSALVLLDDNPDAVKLVATWPVVGSTHPGCIGETIGGEPRITSINEEAVVYWALVSGVDEEDVRRLMPLLFHNDILGTRGRVDENAKRYVNAKVAAKLPKART